jgi:single-strand DNA-binding protein
MARSLNRVQLIGNLTRDPELRYTPNGNAVCTFSVATNRNWTTDSGEKREEVDFHRIVAWNKLGELCSQFLTKGRKVYVEGRLSTRNWTAQDGAQKTTTEVIIDDMILLDNKGAGGQPAHGEEPPLPEEAPVGVKTKKAESKMEEEVPSVNNKEEEVLPEDIPF